MIRILKDKVPNLTLLAVCCGIAAFFLYIELRYQKAVSGYCFAENRKVSDQEISDKVIENLIHELKIPHKPLKVKQGYVQMQYDSVTHFREINPDCCTINRPAPGVHFVLDIELMKKTQMDTTPGPNKAHGKIVFLYQYNPSGNIPTGELNYDVRGQTSFQSDWCGYNVSAGHLHRQYYEMED